MYSTVCANEGEENEYAELKKSMLILTKLEQQQKAITANYTKN